MTIKYMEKRFGIKIRDDSFWDPFKQKYVRQYKIYTADGCQWENGLSMKGLETECKKYGKMFKTIAARM